MNKPEDYSAALAALRAWQETLLRKANVTGVAVGWLRRRGQNEPSVGLVVLVAQKVPLSDLDPADRIPPEIDGVPIDVREAGFVSSSE